MRLLAFLVPILIVACESQDAPPRLDAEKIYKRDMIVTIDGKTFEGIAVVPQKDKYSFEVEAHGDLDLFKMESCHKEETKERAWNVSKTVSSGLFGWGSKSIKLKRRVDFEYIPNAIEREGNCALELSGFEKSKGRHSWAFVDFESPSFTLEAILECNGRTIKASGVSACGAREGLVQRITFAEQVVPADNNECGIEAVERKIFEFDMPIGKCAVVFSTLDGKKLHRLTLLGHNALLIRE